MGAASAGCRGNRGRAGRRPGRLRARRAPCRAAGRLDALVACRQLFPARPWFAAPARGTWDDGSVFYWVTKYTLGMTLKIVFRPRAWGAKNVPRRGPVILASNHLSFSDHFFGPLPVPRKVIFLAK